MSCSYTLVLEHVLMYLLELYNSLSLAFPYSPQALVTTVCLSTSMTSISFSFTNEWGHIVFFICVCTFYITQWSPISQTQKNTSKNVRPVHEELYLNKLIRSASATSCYLPSHWWLIFNTWIKELHYDCFITVALILWVTVPLGSNDPLTGVASDHPAYQILHYDSWK